MVISSRTPEGEPLSCAICGALDLLEASGPGDLLCPRCGTLAWSLREQLPQLPTPLTADDLHRPLTDFADSTDFVGLIVSWEETHPDLASLAAANQIRTVADVLRWLARESAG